MQQLSLFNVPVKKSRYSFRGPYKKHPKLKNDWTKMSEAYSILASYLPVSICNSESYTTDYYGIRLWFTVYPVEAYTYLDEICMGENFKVIEAEIIGTEKLGLQERLKLHMDLIELLRSGQQIEKAMTDIKQKINNIPKKELGGFALWLKQLRG